MAHVHNPEGGDRYGSPRLSGHSTIKYLELNVPPIVIVFLSAAMMYSLAATFRHEDVLIMPLRIGLSLSAAVIAITILILAVSAFHKHRTTVNPLDPEKATSIVRSGIYSYSRNPMYLAMFIALLAWGLLLGQVSTSIGLAVYVFAITRLQILPEEKILTRKFGGNYVRYVESTGRFLGRRE